MKNMFLLPAMAMAALPLQAGAQAIDYGTFHTYTEAFLGQSVKLIQGKDGNLWGIASDGDISRAYSLTPDVSGSGHVETYLPQEARFSVQIKGFLAQTRNGTLFTYSTAAPTPTDPTLCSTPPTSSEPRRYGSIWRVIPGVGLEKLTALDYKIRCPLGKMLSDGPYVYFFDDSAGYLNDQTTDVASEADLTPPGNGTLWRLHESGELTRLHVFVNNDEVKQGSLPVAVTLGSDGWLYGSTSAGGESSGGTLWKIDPNPPDGTTPTSTFSVLHHFVKATDGSVATGAFSTFISDLVDGGDGYIYGTTFFNLPLANANGRNSIFRVNQNGGENAFETLYTFTSASNGGFNVTSVGGGLVKAYDGKIYGTANGAVTNVHSGVLFRFDPAAIVDGQCAPATACLTLTQLPFVGNDLQQIALPQGLIEGRNGKLYGNARRVIEITPEGAKPNPSILYFHAEKVALTYEGSPLGTTLHWSVENLDSSSGSCTATSSTEQDDWSGAITDLEGTKEVAIANGQTTFTLTCQNGDEAAKTTVQTELVQADQLPGPVNIASFQSNLSSVEAEKPFILSWQTQNAAFCEIDGISRRFEGSEAAAGQYTVTPNQVGNQSYVLTCTGLLGSSDVKASPAVNVQVTVPGGGIVSGGGGGGGALSWSALLSLGLLLALRLHTPMWVHGRHRGVAKG